MSEVHIEEHSSPIKTPRQLIIVVVLAFAVPIALAVMIAQLVTGGSRGPGDAGLKEEAIAKRLKPVGEVVVLDPNTPRVEKTGKQVVDTICGACHMTGALNAPKIGDKAAWARMVNDGFDKTTASAIKGIRQMPARGGNPDLTDTEVARAVAFMGSQSGATWTEPEAKPGPAAKPVAAAAPPAAPGPATAVAAAPAAATDAGKGKTVYDASCVVCHGAGVAGAPKAGDKAAWAPRLKTGMDAMYTSALKGKNAMPPKGGNLSLADADVKAAVDYLAGLAK